MIFFQNQKIYPLKKIISYKPKDITDKQALVESGAISLDEFTFFDTLNDPEMKKYVGLTGRVISPNTTQYFPENIISSKFKNKLKNKSKPGSFLSRFILQVGSFQEFKKANVLKDKMINSGYSAFISSALAKEKDYKLHRVFVGNFMERAEAEKIAVKIKKTEKIVALVRYFEKKN